MLLKAHLTSHSRMSGSRWVITPSWLSGSWRSVLNSSSVYSCHLFFISSASVRSIPFLSFIVPIFAWYLHQYSLGISNFLEEISSLSHSIVFLYFFCIDCWGRFSYLSLLFFGTLDSNGYIFPFLLCLSFSLLFSAICKASSDNHFAFLHFFFLGMVLITASCTMSWTSIHSSSGTLSTRSNPLSLLLTWYNHKGFDLGHTWMV